MVVECVMQGSVLKNIVEAIREMVDETKINFTSRGLSLGTVFFGKAIVVMHLPANAFYNYHCDTTTSVGVNINNMANILRSVADNDIISVLPQPAADNLTFIVQSPSRIAHLVMNLMDVNSMTAWCISKMQYQHAIVKMPSAEFSRICSDLACVGDTVTIKITEEGVEFSTKGDFGTSTIIFRHNTANSVQMMMKETVCFTFSLGMMNTFTKATPLSNIVTIYFSNQLKLAVLIEYKIAEIGYLHFYLRPVDSYDK